MIQVNREVGDAIIDSRRTAEMGRIAMMQAIERNFVCADRMAVAIVVAHFDLERPGIGAGIVNLAVNRDLASRPHQLNLRELYRLGTEKRVEHKSHKAHRDDDEYQRSLTHESTGASGRRVDPASWAISKFMLAAS